MAGLAGERGFVLRNKLIWIGAVVALGLAVGAFFLLRPAAVAVAKPERGLAVEAVYATGTVEPRSYAQVGSKIAGHVVELKAREGDRVAPGDVLAVIDLGQDAANVDELQAKLKLAEADAARARKLRRSGNVSIAALDQAESVLGAADAALKSAKAKLDDHYIRAPIAGVVLRSEQQIKVGDMVEPQQTLFIVGDPSSLQIDAEVDEEDITRVKPGQEALIRADAFNRQVLNGTVADITPYGDPVARTYRVHIALPPDTPLLSGMTTEINIVVRKQEDALLVPVSALSGGTVWTIVDGRAVQVKVELGAVAKDKAEIKSGLGDDATVILNPPSTLKPGTRLRAATS